jgi:hypothetical protein
LLLSCFLEKKYFHGNVGTYKIGELHQHISLGFFCWGRSLKNTHRNRKGVVYISFRSTVENFDGEILSVQSAG